MKKILLGLLIGIGVFITACSGEQETTASQTETTQSSALTLNVAVSYAKTAYISYQGSEPYLALDGVTYINGDLLPVWKEVEERLGVKLEDKADTTAASTSQQFVAQMNESFANVDILNGTVDQFTTYGVEGQIVNLGEYIDVDNYASAKLPNLSKFLYDNPSVYTSIQATDGSIYFAPYFDGLNELEKMILMNTTWIENLLDNSDNGDTSYGVSGYTMPYPSLQFDEYSATQPENINTKIMVPASSTTVKTYTKEHTNNIITLMNNELSANEYEMTGKALLDMFKTYLETTYADAFTQGIYTKLSDIFTTSSAGYDVDELIALMRIIKANPKTATGDANKLTVTVYTPRTGEASRKRDVTRFMQIWGIRGVEARTEWLYFDKDGFLHDARGTDEFKDGITYLNQLYSEGLIQENYHTGYNNVIANEWRLNLMRTNSMFMTYDYNGTTTVYSKVYTNGNDLTGFEACLPPVNNWDDGDIVSTENPGVEYFCFTESVRSLKSDAWGLPIAAKNNPAKLDKLLELIDYFYSEEGNELICYGPDEWIDQNELYSYNGVNIPKISANALTEMRRMDLLSQGDMWEYYRLYVGATINIGYVRGLGIEYQNLTDAGKLGIEKLNYAIKAGSFKIATTFADYASQPFYMLVPGVFTLTSSQQETLMNRNLVQSIFSDTSAHEKYIEYGWGNVLNNTVSIETYNNYVTNDFAPYFLNYYRNAWNLMLLLNS